MKLYSGSDDLLAGNEYKFFAVSTRNGDKPRTDWTNIKWIGRGAMHNPWIFGQIADAWEGKPARVITAAEALEIFKLYYGFKIEDGSTEMGALGRLKQLGARLCKGFCIDEQGPRACRGAGADGAGDESQDVAMHIRQTLLTAQNADEFFGRLEDLRNGFAKDLRYDPSRLVNLNGAKETELKFGDQFAGR